MGESNKVFKYLGYLIVGIFSLILACVLSFSITDWITHPHVSSQGDALGFFIVLGVSGFVWFPIALISQFWAHSLFPAPSAHFKRVAFSFAAPIIVAAIITALVAWLL